MNATGRTANRRAILSAALGIAVAVTIVVLVLTSGAGGKRPQAARGQGTGQPARGPLRLVQGRDLVNGIRTGYPHTLQGAVSAAVEYLGDIGSTLDPDRAAWAMRTVADPSFTDAAQQAATGAEADRALLGLPSSGDVPQGASLILQPVEYQLRGITADQMTILLLADMTGTMPGQGTMTRTGVFPLRMHWAASDWKVLPFASADYSGLAAEPFSAEAEAKGWNYLEPAGE